MAHAREVLERDVAEEGADVAGDDLDALVGEWSGMLQVEWRVAAADAAAIGLAAPVVRECLANAVVHGRATRATVSIDRDVDGVQVEVVDDGVGPQGGAAGVGTSVLDRETGGGWRLDAAPGGGARVVARVPVTGG